MAYVNKYLYISFAPIKSWKTPAGGPISGSNPDRFGPGPMAQRQEFLSDQVSKQLERRCDPDALRGLVVLLAAQAQLPGIGGGGEGM